MAFKMKSPFPQKPKTREGNVYVGPKPNDPNYVKGDEFKMSDKPMYEGHKPSTHLMAYGESDGKYVAYPTLFQTEDGVWYEGGFEDAIKKGEIYKFNTEKEAADFAAGSWKNKK